MIHYHIVQCVTSNAGRFTRARSSAPCVKVCGLRISGSFPRGVRTPPLRIKTLLESNPLKSSSTEIGRNDGAAGCRHLARPSRKWLVFCPRCVWDVSFVYFTEISHLSLFSLIASELFEAENVVKCGNMHGICGETCAPKRNVAECRGSAAK